MGQKKNHYQFTSIDDCTRIRVLRIYGRNKQKSAIQFIDYVLEKLPLRVECIQTSIQAGLRVWGPRVVRPAPTCGEAIELCANQLERDHLRARLEALPDHGLEVMSRGR